MVTKTSAEPQPVVKDSDYPSPAYAWYVTVILALAYVVSFIDRQLLALLVEPVKETMELSDTQMSLLLGLAFGIFYTFMSVPIGRLADRYNRRNIVAAGIALWCIMTAACGLARNYAQLFIARVLVGVGEATLTPCAFSMISDYFPKQTRGKAISFFTLGISVGAGLAMVLGGLIVHWVLNAPKFSVPGIGELHSWQTVFLVVGLPGVLLSFVMLATVREPSRKELLATPGTGAAGEPLSIRFVIQYLMARRMTYGLLFFGMSVSPIIGYAFFSWLPTMFVRVHGWTIRDIGVAYGIILLTCGPLGVFLGGWLADHLFKRGHKDGHLRATVIGVLINVPTAVLVPLMPNGHLALFWLALMSLSGAMLTATGISSLMMLVPNQMRGQISALYQLITNLMGLLIGPVAVGLLTDYLFADELKVNYSIALVAGCFGTIAAIMLALNLRSYTRTMEDLERETG